MDGARGVLARAPHVPKTWGSSPYSALAAELNFCNEGLNQCGSLSQGRQRLIRKGPPRT